MNAHIAAFLKTKIATLTYVDKIAGLVRPITYERAGAKITIPVGIDVSDPLECEDSSLLSLVPNEAYRMIVYFEDRGTESVKVNNRPRLISHLRLVCWVNTTKLDGDNNAGERVMQEFSAAIPGAMYNENGYLGIRHKIEGYPAKGKELFSQYTYPDGVRQYLLWPFDAFAIDISTEYRMDPNCEPDPIVADDAACWTPPPQTGGVGPAPTCRLVRVCGDPEIGDTLVWDGDQYVHSPLATSGEAGGEFTWDPILGLMFTKDGNLYQVQLNA